MSGNPTNQDPAGLKTKNGADRGGRAKALEILREATNRSYC